MRLKLAITVLSVMVASACQQAPVRDEGEDSTRSRIAVGSTIVLNEALTVPAGHARVFLQNGKIKTKVKIERYRPHCNFEVRNVSDGSLQIEPDRFVVTDLIEDEEEVVEKRGPVQYAALKISGGMDTVTLTSRFVRHSLNSASQPDVLWLTCHGGFADPFDVEYPSISDIRKALGEWVTLELVDR